MVFFVDDVWCVSYSVAVSVCSVVVCPIVAFNSTSSELSFTASGEDGTIGYVKVAIDKDMVSNITNLRVYLNGTNLDYTVTSEDSSWILYFVYTHSTHDIVINLGEDNVIIPEIGFLSITFLMAISILGSLIYCRHRKKNRQTNT